MEYKYKKAVMKTFLSLILLCALVRAYATTESADKGFISIYSEYSEYSDGDLDDNSDVIGTTVVNSPTPDVIFEVDLPPSKVVGYQNSSLSIALGSNMRKYYSGAMSLPITIGNLEFRVEITLNRNGGLHKCKIEKSKHEDQLSEIDIHLEEIRRNDRSYWRFVRRHQGHEESLIEIASEVFEKESRRESTSGKVVIYVAEGRGFRRNTYEYQFSSRGYSIASIGQRQRFSVVPIDLFDVSISRPGAWGRLKSFGFKFWTSVMEDRKESIRSKILEYIQRIIDGTRHESLFPEEKINALTDEILGHSERRTNGFSTSFGHIFAVVLREAMIFADELLLQAVESFEEYRDLDLAKRTLQEVLTPFKQCLDQSIELENDGEVRKCIDKSIAQGLVDISEKIFSIRLVEADMGGQVRLAIGSYRTCLNEHYYPHFVNRRNEIINQMYKRFKAEGNASGIVKACLYSSTLGLVVALERDIANNQRTLLDRMVSHVADSLGHELRISREDKLQAFTQVRACLQSQGLGSGEGAGQLPFGQLKSMDIDHFNNKFLTCFDLMKQSLSNTIMANVEGTDMQSLAVAEFTQIYDDYRDKIFHSLREIRTWGQLYNSVAKF